MAAGIIKVSPEQLRATASEFSSQGSAILSTTSNMMQLVQGSSSAWTGEAATAYVAKFNQLQDDMERAVRMVQEYSTDLQEMAAVFQNAETENANLAESLSGDVLQ